MNRFPKRVRLLTSLLGLLVVLNAITPTSYSRQTKSFAGPVRLILPRLIYAVPDIETNIYFDNIVLVVNPANYIFDVTCDVGFQFDDRWTYLPSAKEAGDHPIMVEVRNETNVVIARARSIVRVVLPAKGQSSPISVLAIGDSHLQRDVYIQHVLELSKGDPDVEITLVGSRGVGNKPQA